MRNEHVSILIDNWMKCQGLNSQFLVVLAPYVAYHAIMPNEHDPIRPQRPATTFDVARLAGVSRATVSRAFDENGIIDQKTRVKVLAAASQLDYQPHAIARSLNRRRSDLVALLVDNLRNPFEAEMHDLLISKLADLKLQPMIVPIKDRSQMAQRLRTAAGYQVAAAMAWADSVTPEVIRSAFGATTPCIMINGQVGKHVDTIRTDPRPGFVELIALIHNEHRRFGFIAGRSASFQARERGECLRDALAAHGKSIHNVGEGDFSYESGYRAALTLLRGRNPIDCLIAANDMMAMGAMDAARHILNLKIPEDLSVVGFDGIEAANWPSYDLTTITATMPVMVEHIIECLTTIGRLPERDAVEHKLVTRVVWRSSVNKK